VSVRGLENLLSEGKASGEFRDFDTRSIAVLIRNAIDGAASRLREEPGFDAYTREVVATFTLGILVSVQRVYGRSYLRRNGTRVVIADRDEIRGTPHGNDYAVSVAVQGFGRLDVAVTSMRRQGAGRSSSPRAWPGAFGPVHHARGRA
jgi:hypothetical protein